MQVKSRRYWEGPMAHMGGSKAHRSGWKAPRGGPNHPEGLEFEGCIEPSNSSDINNFKEIIYPEGNELQ